MKIAAVVPTYNRKKLLKECLISLLKQTRPLDDVIIVDNASNDGTKELIDSEFGFLSYFYLKENTGSAGGFYYGIKKAYEKGFDWIWVIDNDTEVYNNALEKIVKSEIFSTKVAAFCPMKIDNQGNSLLNIHFGFWDCSRFSYKVNGLSAQDLKKKYVEIDLMSFTGTLINYMAVQRIGFPSPELFTQRDDNDYCFRLRSFGKFYLIPDSIIVHKESENFVKVKRFGINFRRSKISSVWKEYYGFRNILFLFRQNYIPRWRILNFVWYLLKTTIAILLLDKNKFFRLKYYYLGLFDGLCGRFGKTIDPASFTEKYKKFLKENH